MRVGDVVIPSSTALSEGKVLRCGTHQYTHAIVGSVEPFILVSDDGTMVWSATWTPEDVVALCRASESIQRKVRKRITSRGR